MTFLSPISALVAQDGLEYRSLLLPKRSKSRILTARVALTLKYSFKIYAALTKSGIRYYSLFEKKRIVKSNQDVTPPTLDKCWVYTTFAKLRLRWILFFS